MELEKQVISLELAKKLKELGCKQESLFWWHGYPTAPEKDFCLSSKDQFVDFSNNLVPFEYVVVWHNNKIYSAFTVAEVGEMLPQEVIFNDPTPEIYVLNYNKFGTPYYSFYEEFYYVSDGSSLTQDTEANARAKMLVHLIENGLMEV